VTRIYRNSDGVYYAPRWKNRHTGTTTPAHSLGTADRALAEELWVLEQAAALRPVSASEGAFRPRRPAHGGQLSLIAETFDSAVRAYCASKRRWTAATRDKWAKEIPTILGRRFASPTGVEISLGPLRVSEFAGEAGTELLAAWADAEIARHNGRTHTTVKRIANLIRPSLALAARKGWLPEMPTFPDIASDYRPEGRRKIWLSRVEFVSLATELTERDAILRKGRPPLAVYPRLWAMIAVSTGMHDADISRFSTADWDRKGERWYRRNSKNANHYPPEWFPCRQFLQQSLTRAAERFSAHHCARWDNWDRSATPARCISCGRSADLWVADGEAPPDAWMRQRLKWGCKRARLDKVPAPIDFRRTFATWARQEKWEFEEVAKWLANSTGMVREVYAQLENARFERLVTKNTTLEREILDMVSINAAGSRRGPRIVRTQFLAPQTPVATAVANGSNGKV
jgi:hypothetical protein